ncbi:aminopeptidase [Clostridium sp. Cult2]|uniref:aminopeptidase n=1 Tax=Clostridium sp. Cult2 TaxID=2079003 RepID=UPI001F35671C|nr:aminopeptidase [Clostridium sp. Cult2]MCF6464463.1 aminopeptidase [Clostridium sp. Cult2]
MKNFNETLEQYARLCVEVGINLQKGQPLVINAPVEGAEFVRLVAKHAYEIGAKQVHVNWNDEALTKMKYENAPMEVFENFPKWYANGLEEFAEDGAGFLSIYSEDPELLKEIDSKKIAAHNKSSSMALKGFMKYTMNDINSWCVVSIPTKGWAKKVFPDVTEEEAMEKLWEAIFKATRMDLEDPVKAWEDHLKNLEAKVKFLNEKKFEKLYYKSCNGTDLEVQLPEGHIWAGGGGKNSKGVFFVANMPTEEVFTMPLKTGVNGVVHSTKPLNYGGNLIDNFKLTFKDGKVVDFEAEKGYEILKDLFALDEGAQHLGEVALVPYNSPISQSNTIFLNTLFDENASCHFALGKAYPTNLKGGENMTDEELEKAGVNDSLTHVDFMVGSKDLNIVGETKDGEKVQIFENGNWAF